MVKQGDGAEDRRGPAGAGARRGREGASKGLTRHKLALGACAALLAVAACLPGASLLRTGRSSPAGSAVGPSSPGLAEVDDLGATLDQRVAAGLKRGPVVVAFTYGAECCESTKRFFEEYQADVESVVEPLGGRVTLIWADVAASDRAEQLQIQRLARNYSVTKVPTTLVLGRDGQTRLRWEGTVDAQVLRSAIDKALTGR